MSRQLTTKSSRDVLKREAKRWLKALRSGDADARRRLERAYSAAPVHPRLRDVQHALAREHGLDGWRALIDALDDLRSVDQNPADRAADFLEYACLHYGAKPGGASDSEYPENAARRQRALKMLQRHPELARHGIHTAVVCGELAEVERILARDPAAASEQGGREGWVPLLFLCYGRLPLAQAADNAVAIAELLLDHGADPNAFWAAPWNAKMTWSSVCGAIGGGEDGGHTPPHPKAQELATLLLDRGADVNQGQALYNTMLRADDTRWLRFFIERGLTARHPASWDPSAPTTLFQYLLGYAAENNQRARAKLLLEHGADPNPPATAGDSNSRERSFYERALLVGNLELAELLVQHGARRTELPPEDAFRAACMRRDAGEARRSIAENPAYAHEAGRLLVEVAAANDMLEVAEFLLDLGVAPDFEIKGSRALNLTACTNSVRVARLLLERGADVDGVPDGEPHAPPLGWALRVRMPEMIDLLSRHSRDVFALCVAGHTERLRELLEQDPALANSVVTQGYGLGWQGAAPGDTPLHVLPEDDEDLAFEVAELLLEFGADPTRQSAGKTAADKARARGLVELADLLEPK